MNIAVPSSRGTGSSNDPDALEVARYDTLEGQLTTAVAPPEYRAGSGRSQDQILDIMLDALRRGYRFLIRTIFNGVLYKVVAPRHLSVFWGDRMLTLDKATSFFEDEAFRRAYEAVRGSHLYDSYDYAPHDRLASPYPGLGGAERDHAARRSGGMRRVQGRYVVGIASVLGDKIADRTFYLYDSFEGFSPTLTSRGRLSRQPVFSEDGAEGLSRSGNI